MIIPVLQNGELSGDCEQVLSTLDTAVPITYFSLFIKSNIQVLAFVVIPFPKGTSISKWGHSKETSKNLNAVSASQYLYECFWNLLSTFISIFSKVVSVENLVLKIIFILFWGWDKLLFRKFFFKRLLIFETESGMWPSHFLLVVWHLGRDISLFMPLGCYYLRTSNGLNDSPCNAYSQRDS